MECGASFFPLRDEEVKGTPPTVLAETTAHITYLSFPKT